MNPQLMISIPERNLTIGLDPLAASFELQAPAAYAHGRRAAAYAGILARRLGLPPAHAMAVEKAVLLHDAGTMQIPDRIMQKTDRLSDVERHMRNNHPIAGYAMLSSMAGVQDIAEIILTHHERYDGSGYPHRLEGEDIPMGARICAVVDCLDALTSPDETVRRIFAFPEACRYIGTRGGTRFDPQVVEAFRSIPPEEWRQLQQTISQSAGHGQHPLPVEPVASRSF
ncbi:MAG TPA: HD domain-containing phosphohydrolase [Nitrospiraceae bacterium]|nr:HD domain-containing phosphohydrolase [Nitrospiraceae bacterium]